MELTPNNLERFMKLQQIWLNKQAIKEAQDNLRRAKEAVSDQRDDCANDQNVGGQIERVIDAFAYETYMKQDKELPFFLDELLHEEFPAIGWTIYDTYEGLKNSQYLVFPREYAEELMNTLAKEFFLKYKKVKVKNIPSKCYYGDRIDTTANIEWVCYKISPEVRLNLKEI